MLLPNPFEFVEVVMPSASKAAVSSPIAPAEDAAATPFPRGFDSCVLEEILGLPPILPMTL
jgi:hypothetical protein